MKRPGAKRMPTRGNASPRRDAGSPRPSGPASGARRPDGHAGTGELVFGLRAGLAVLDARPKDIVRIGFTQDVRAETAALSAWAKAHRIPCDALLDGDLERIAGTPHHEGLVLETRARTWTPAADLASLLTRTQGAAVALDRVRNPYNVGSILRTAAFLGLDAALLGSPAPHPALSPDAVRVAEGGAEHLALSRTTDLADTLGRLRARGVQVVGADQHARSVFARPPGRPTVLVLGHEREGLSERVRGACDALVSIPGAGPVESLNVGVAAGLLMAELVRDRLMAR